MRNVKKWTFLTLVVVMTTGLMAVPAQAAAYVLDLGTISGIWSASEEPVGTEVVSLQYEKGLNSSPSPDGTPTYIPTGEGERTISLYPVGTEFTLIKQGVYAGKPCDVITVEYYKEGFRTNVTHGDITTKVLIEDTETIYKISNVTYAYGVIKDLYVRGVKIDPVVGSFTDVSAAAYYADAVKWAVDKEITSGTSATTFSPDETCTNSQILTFLWKAKGQPEPTISNPFTDVKTSDYFYKAAVWAYEKGLIAGTTLGVDVPCTRSMVVTYLWKLAGQPAAAKTTSFTDVNSSAEYAAAVAWAVEKGITSGTSAAAFEPDTICTRGQIVTFLHHDMA